MQRAAILSVPPRQPNALARAAYLAATARVTRTSIEDLFGKNDAAARAIIERAAAPVGSTSASGFGVELVQDSLRQFLSDLAPYSGASRLIQLAVPANVGANGSVSYPVRTSGRTAPSFVRESGEIPMQAAAFGLVEIGPAKKMAHMLSWSRELSKRSDAERIFEQMLREDMGAGIDAAFFSTAAATDDAPAGLLYGVSALSGFPGGDREAIEADLCALADSVAPGGSGNLTYVMAPARVARLRIKHPELAASIDIAASSAVPVGRIIGADGASLLVSIDPQPDIERSSDATIHMSDVPLPLSDSGVADPVRSLWQTASIAARVIHEIAFSKRRSAAVAYIDGASW